MMLDHMFDSKDFFHNKSRKNKAGVVYQSLKFGLLKQISALETQKARIGWLPKYMTSSGYNMQKHLQINPYKRWFEIIFEYSRRNYTKDTDILPALGGIARAFADLTKDNYCAGMWESELLQSICWWRRGVVLNKAKKYGPPNIDFTKPSAYRAPSWSWASINGGRVAIFSSTIGDAIPIKNIATPIKVHLEPLEGGDKFGQLQSGYLIIKGSLFTLGDLWAEYWQNVSPSWEEFKEPKNDQINLRSCKFPALNSFVLQLLNEGANETFEFEQQHVYHSHQRFAALVIAQIEGIEEEDRDNERESMKGAANLLLLESTGSKDDEYRRISVLILRRPSQLSVIVPEIHRTETQKWKEISEEQWRRFEEEVKWLTVGVLEAKAWIEVAKQAPKRTTIRIM